MESGPDYRRSRALLCGLVLLAVNLAIVGPLFRIEYLVHTGSIEGTFIGLARLMAKYPGQWSWWPFWNGGLPFENAYLPLVPWIVAALTMVTGTSAARSLHVVLAAFYTLGSLSLFWMALRLSRRLWASWIAALLWSCVSASTLLIPAVRADAGDPLALRRLQILVFYGEGPHLAALALLPVAVLCFRRALGLRPCEPLPDGRGSVSVSGPRPLASGGGCAQVSEPRPSGSGGGCAQVSGPRPPGSGGGCAPGGAAAAWWKIAAGVSAAAVVLCNAFGLFGLALALAAWLLVYRGPLPAVAAIGVASYCWVSPWLSPGMIRAMRANAPTSGGDFRYTTASWIALALLAAGYAMVWWAMRRARASDHLRFFCLLAWWPAGFLLAWYGWGVPVVPQPFRYQLEADMLLPLVAVFAAAAVLDRVPRIARLSVAGVAVTVLALQSGNAIGYARRLIRPADVPSLSEYRVARWLQEHRPGDRAYLTGSASLLFNAFSDNPQLHGGHDQHTVNTFIPIVTYTVQTDRNAGRRAAECSIAWLKVFGVRQIHVSGPGSTDFYKPFTHPDKFDGVLPLVWRDRGDSIYEVPARSPSLAHLIPATAVVARRPVHGLDTAAVEPYLAALDDPAVPEATFRWNSLSEAAIHATVAPGQVLSVQVTYAPGWEAWANGRRQRVRGDAMGQVVVEPDCSGPCDISLRYSGGTERIVTRSLSLAAMLAAGVFLWRSRRRSLVT